MPNDTMLYLAYGDNMNAKNLYYACKKEKISYPFVRMLSKAYIPDFKLAVLKRDGNKRYGLITIEESVGHIVPGLLFEVKPESDLSILAESFEKIDVFEVFSNRGHTALVNKFETNNLIDMQKARLSKGRKRIYRQAIKWRNLEDFETCYESAMCNYLYPYLVKKIFIPRDMPEVLEFLKPDEFNSTDAILEIGEGKGKQGKLFFSNTLKIKHDLQKIDAFAVDAIRYVGRVHFDDEVPELVWTYENV